MAHVTWLAFAVQVALPVFVTNVSPAGIWSIKVMFVALPGQFGRVPFALLLGGRGPSQFGVQTRAARRQLRGIAGELPAGGLRFRYLRIQLFTLRRQAVERRARQRELSAHGRLPGLPQ